VRQICFAGSHGDIGGWGADDWDQSPRVSFGFELVWERPLMIVWSNIGFTCDPSMDASGSLQGWSEVGQTSDVAICDL
jgi:hypothetical protein